MNLGLSRPHILRSRQSLRYCILRLLLGRKLPGPKLLQPARHGPRQRDLTGCPGQVSNAADRRRGEQMEQVGPWTR